MRLAELQSLVHRALRGEVLAEDAAATLGVPARRLTLYRDFVVGHVTGVLAKVYPYVRAMTPGSAWEAIATAFERDVPATARELNACVASFPEWLTRQPEGHARPWLAELAQLEWNLFAAWAHEADVPAPNPPDVAPRPLAINPTATAFQAAFGVVPWMVAHAEASDVTPDTPPPEPLAAPHTVLVFRKALSHRTAFYVATGDYLFALKVVSEGIAPADAAALAGVPLAAAEAAMQAAIDVGLLV